MATNTDEDVLFSGRRRSVHHITGRNTDGTAETDVQKIDISTLTSPNGGTPSQVYVEAIEYLTSGFGNVQLLFDNSTNERIANLAGSGEVSWVSAGGFLNPATGTGDILLTTRDAAANDTYDITVWLKHKD